MLTSKKKRLYFLIIPMIVLFVAIAGCFVYYTFISPESEIPFLNIFFKTKPRTDIFYPSKLYYISDRDDHKVVAQEVRDKQYMFLPSSADISALTLYYDNYTGTQVFVRRGDGDESASSVPFENGSTINIEDLYDYSTPSGGVYALEFEYLKDGKLQNEYLYVMFSQDIPALFLEIDESQGKIEDMNADQDVKCYGSAGALYADSSYEKYGTMTIGGRGNSTWKRDKKPYMIKLNSKRDVLGMGSAKTWILLANYDDSSLVRNAIGFDLSEMLEFGFTCEYRYVDLYMNGVYLGNYMVCEKIQIDEQRLNIYDLEDEIDVALKRYNSRNDTEYEYLSDLMAADPDNAYISDDGHTATVIVEDDTYIIDLTQGYLLEFDYYTDDIQLRFDSVRKVTVKSPENLASSIDDRCFDYITSFLYDANDAILSSTGYNQSGAYYTEYIDTESFARMWMAKEYSMDWDACVSIYMYMDEDHKLHAGPLWDNDNAFGMSESIYNNTDINYNVVLNGGYHSTLDSWLTKLMNFQDFLDTVKRLFRDYSYVFNNHTMSNLASNHVSAISASANMNFMLWREKYNITSELYLVSFLNRRDNYFNTYVPALEVETESGDYMVEDGTYYIESSLQIDKVIESVDGEQDGSDAVLGDYRAAESQRFYLSSAGNGYYNIVSLDTGKLLTVDTLSRVDGTEVGFETAGAGDRQLWKVKYSSSGYFYIIAFNGMYLTVEDANAGADSKLVVNVGSNSKNQKFRFIL